MSATLPKSEYDAYRHGQNAAFRLTVILWALILGSLFGLGALAQSTLPLVAKVPIGAALFVFLGWLQASISNGFHEACHENLIEGHGKRPKFWDRVSAILLGYPTFFTLTYREVHTQHHVKGGDPTEDPDVVTYGGFPRSRMEMLGRFATMATGVSAAQQVLRRVFGARDGDSVEAKLAAARKQRAARHGSATPMGELPWLVATQLGIVALFLGIFGWPWGLAWYVGFWILPLGTIAKTVKASRSFCEHGAPDNVFVLRTITGKPWQLGTLGMYGFSYHAEHHLYPWVPYSKLPELHERLKADILATGETRLGKYELFEGGYFALLAKWFSDLPWTAPPAAAENAARSEEAAA